MANQTYLELMIEVGARAAEMSAQLIAQKNQIIAWANEGSAASLERALTCVQFASPLWVAADYGYKVGEMVARCKQGVEALLEAPVTPTVRRQLEALLARCE